MTIWSGVAAEAGGKLDVGRPAKLPDGLDPQQSVAAIDQGPGVAREGRRVAADVGDPLDRRAGELRNLLLGAGARRVERHPGELAKPGGVERPAIEIAMIDLQR